jgi:hypothetical protein
MEDHKTLIFHYILNYNNWIVFFKVEINESR